MDNELLEILQKQQGILRRIVQIEQSKDLDETHETNEIDEYRSLIFELVDVTCQCAAFLRKSIQLEEQEEVN